MDPEILGSYLRKLRVLGALNYKKKREISIYFKVRREVKRGKEQSQPNLE